MSTKSDGWDKLHTGQRFERAKYLVTEYLEDRHRSWNVAEIARDLEESANPVSAFVVKGLIDLYAVGTGVVAVAENRRSISDFSAGQNRLDAAWQDHAAKVEVTDRDVAKVRKQFPKADQVTVERIAKGRAIGEVLVERGKIDVDDDGFHLNTPDPRSIQQIKDKHGVPVNQDQWRKKFTEYATDCRRFTTFLRGSKQGMMVDEHLAVQLQNLATSFQEQADRFDVGVAKASARS